MHDACGNPKGEGRKPNTCKTTTATNHKEKDNGREGEVGARQIGAPQRTDSKDPKRTSYLCIYDTTI